MNKVTYAGSPPSNCDICNRAINAVFIDGATKMGPWANMCPACHKTHGKGLGIGRGQKFKKDDGNPEWVKTEG